MFLFLIVAAITVSSCLANPGRPTIDNPQATLIFQTAERNRTNDGFITSDELKDIFRTFDLNSDGVISNNEWLFIWRDRKLGDDQSGERLFHNLDTDKDSVVSEVPDMFRVFYYFDSDNDGKISQQEFVVVWESLGQS